jgi:hypothetical protein
VPPAVASQLTPPLVFRSAFEGYQPYIEQKMASWKEANDTVGKIGGFREYAREASQPENAAPPGEAAVPTDPKAVNSKP